jgi:ERCC4-type nuclease
MLKVDSREAALAQKVLEELSKLGVKYEVEKLECGDYLFPAEEKQMSILIERKDIFDFAHSIRDNRLWTQLSNIASLEIRSALLIEGSPAILEKAKRGWNIGSIYGAINTIWLNYSIPILFTPSKHYTAILLANLAKKMEGEKTEHYTIPKIKRTEDYSEVALSMLAQIPYVNTVKAKRILEKFETVKNVVENLDRIEEVEGIGEKISEAIKKTFTTKFQQ